MLRLQWTSLMSPSFSPKCSHDRGAWRSLPIPAKGRPLRLQVCEVCHWIEQCGVYVSTVTVRATWHGLGWSAEVGIWSARASHWVHHGRGRRWSVTHRPACTKFAAGKPCPLFHGRGIWAWYLSIDRTQLQCHGAQWEWGGMSSACLTRHRRMQPRHLSGRFKATVKLWLGPWIRVVAMTRCLPDGWAATSHPPSVCCRMWRAEAVFEVEPDDDQANPVVANGDPSVRLQCGGKDIKVEASDVVATFEQSDHPTAPSDAMRGLDLRPPNGGQQNLVRPHGLKHEDHPEVGLGRARCEDDEDRTPPIEPPEGLPQGICSMPNPM